MASNTTDIQEYIDAHAKGHRYEAKIEAETWRDELQRSSRGNVIKGISNTVLYLQKHPELAGKIQHSLFHHETFITGELPFTGADRVGTVWSDTDDVALSVWLERNFCPNNKTDIPHAVDLVGKENPFHPVRDYLDSLEWDGRERIDGWLTTYLGVGMTEYTSAVGSRWLVAAVKRVFEPGSKCDYMLVLEGAQGKRKSWVLSVLAGEWFVEDLCTVGTKDSKQQLQGAWIVEIAEIDKLGRQEAGEVKTFLTQRYDRFRPAYGRRLVKIPRQCIFAGTVNPDVYLRDETGGRRFWPVKCGQIELSALRDDRDQIWAEAMQRYRDGAPVYLETEHLEQLASIEQAKRFAVDAWHFEVADFVRDMQVTYMDRILAALNVDVDKRNNSHSIRVNKIMQALGYVARRSKRGGMKYTKKSLMVR